MLCILLEALLDETEARLKAREIPEVTESKKPLALNSDDSDDSVSLL